MASLVEASSPPVWGREDCSEGWIPVVVTWDDDAVIETSESDRIEDIEGEVALEGGVGLDRGVGLFGARRKEEVTMLSTWQPTFAGNCPPALKAGVNRWRIPRMIPDTQGISPRAVINQQINRTYEILSGLEAAETTLSSDHTLLGLLTILCIAAQGIVDEIFVAAEAFVDVVATGATKV